MTERVVTVIVTHDRRDLLAESLTAVQAQTRRPDLVLVVDNASTDGTGDLVRERFPDIELVALAENTGGAGGFAVGVARALERDADLIWLMDDDTVAEPGALEALLEARRRIPGPPALVASRVVWTDGREHPMNTPRIKPRATREELARATAARCVPIRSASFVSILVEAQAVRERGLPMADYFLWNDDFEFTTRLLRDREGVLCHDSVVTHKTRTFGDVETDPGDRFYYEVRNKVWLFTRSPGLTPMERVLYGGSTARRWVRTFARSRDRTVLRDGFVRGMRAGLRERPRPTGELIARWTAGDESED
ncbi:glycosyltransferase [Thermomonospora cellulosilytica]|uniref:GT2 family glycosyltransferase n=1 Tax=Thermomonospora cellulosilytica TaxID=1411118 RepID=A0A7W3MWJ2_9ACTN|nr:glycosyltransferase [Thermomonospora cellulosilytica]MBA9003191.1 GT2 family glycosyltransferase [Thermomonospora cellulosilytica]